MEQAKNTTATVGKNGVSVNKNSGQVADQLVEQWKKQHGKVYKLTVDGHVCYLRRPSRKILGYASVAGKDDPIKFNEALMRDCWLGGDEAVRTDDVLFISASAKLADLIEVKQAELEEL